MVSPRADGRYRAAMSQVRVAIVFGGRSSEHSISCISASAVWQALEQSGYAVLPVAITPAGAMVRYGGSPADLRALDLPVVDSGDAEVIIACDPAIGGFLVGDERVSVDVVFPVLHGPWGEDGTIQGLLELAGLPYVGSGVLASALCMDKVTLKTVLRATGIAVSDWVGIDATSWADERERVLDECERLGPILFVKPSRAGSSVGITRVDLAASGRLALEDAIEMARAHDPRVIVETAVSGAREIECAVRQTADGRVESSVCAEIVVKEGHDFYDFQAKYVSDGADLIVPAELPDEQAAQVAAIAKSSFQRTGCEGLARVDFFVTKDQVLVNELNTMPGFTPISMFPRMWDASGVSYPELIDGLVQQARARGTGLR